MANTKEYKIVINGLTESINAVDSLNKQLSELENRIKALERSSVKINTTSSGGGSASSGSKSSLNEEEKLAKQIETIDAKREAYSKEIYQNYLAAKDVLAETISDQKQLAAAERLQADAYSNTMAGIKQKLADLKSVHFTTDISTDEFKQQEAEINSLTNKLKELEEAYGVFSRNVGNYKSAFEGFEKVTVTINGVTKEFNSLRQAQKAVSNEMGILIDKGKQNTSQYKKLEQELEKLTKSQKRLTSAMNDAKASSRVMDDILDTFESFTALGQVGQGLSTFFGFDNSEMEQQIAKLVALQNVLNGVEKIRQQMNTQEGFGKIFSKGSKAVDQFVAKIAGADYRMGKIIGTTKSASIALNTFSNVLKGVGAVALTGGFMIITNVIGDLVSKFMKWANAGFEVGDAAKMLNAQFDTMANTFERIKKENVDNYFYKMADETATLKNSLYSVNTELQTLLSYLGDVKEFGGVETTFGITGNIKKPLAGSLDEAKKNFREQLKLIEEYEKKVENSVIPLRGVLSNIFGETGRMKRNVKELGEAILQDFLYRVNEASSKAQQEIAKTGKISKDTADTIRELNKEANEDFAVNSVLNNVEKFSEKGEYYASQIGKVTESLKQLGTYSVIDPAKMEQYIIDGMADSEEKIRKQNELNRKKEIESVDFNPEYIDAINKKYDRELQENLKSYRKTKKQEADQKKKENRDVQREIDEYTIQLMREGLEKQIAELRNEEKYKRKEIEDSGIRVGERTNLLTEVYNKKELELRRDWARDVKEIYEKLGEDIENIERDIFDSGLDTSETNLDTNTAKKKRSTGDNLITPINYDDIEALKTYYKKILEIDQQAADEEVKIKEERLKKQLEYDKEDEKRRHNNLVDSSGGEYVKQLEQGKITQEQYDELIERENKAHTEKMKAIDAQYAADSEKILQDSLDKKRSAYNTYYTSVIADIRKDQDRISKESSSIDKRQDNAAFGFFNIKAVMKGYDELISKEKIAVEKIKTERDKLIQDKNNGKISGEDFLVRQEELDAAEEAAMASIEDLEKKQKTSLDKFIGAIMAAVQVVGQSIQQIFSAVWDAQDAQFEKEQDELDKLNNELDKKLDKQQEIVQKHKDAVNSIEDELATARGDRRQHLIDQLNAEMAAQREAAAQEKKIQKQKEQAEKKQEQLEKKRREEEYKRNVTQAFISWHLGVANALATQPFMPVGIAMGALATALGAVQYALVKSQKPYAKGGQLEGGVAVGKRHSEGGIPVLGGRASIEGGEFITNRETTMRNVDVLGYINSKKKKLTLDDFIDFYGGKVKKNITAISPKAKFADGGTLPTLSYNYDIDNRLITAIEDYANRPYYVSVVDINDRQAQVKNVQVMAGLTE